MGLPAAWAMPTRLLISAKVTSKPAAINGRGWRLVAQRPATEKAPHGGRGWAKLVSCHQQGLPVRRQTHHLNAEPHRWGTA